MRVPSDYSVLVSSLIYLLYPVYVLLVHNCLPKTKLSICKHLKILTSIPKILYLYKPYFKVLVIGYKICNVTGYSIILSAQNCIPHTMPATIVVKLYSRWLESWVPILSCGLIFDINVSSRSVNRYTVVPITSNPSVLWILVEAIPSTSV